MATPNQDKHEPSAHLPTRNREALQTLISAELKAHGISAEAYIRELKTELAAVKKRSSASLLRKKLKEPPGRV